MKPSTIIKMYRRHRFIVIEPDPARTLLDIVHEAQAIANENKRTVTIEYKKIRFKVEPIRIKKNENHS